MGVHLNVDGHRYLKLYVQYCCYPFRTLLQKRVGVWVLCMLHRRTCKWLGTSDGAPLGYKTLTLDGPGPVLSQTGS